MRTIASRRIAALASHRCPRIASPPSSLPSHRIAALASHRIAALGSLLFVRFFDSVRLSPQASATDLAVWLNRLTPIAER